MFKGLAAAVVVMIVVQAALAGQGWFGGQLGLIAVHGWVGNASYVAVIVLAGMAVVGLRRGWGRLPLALALGLVLLMTAQLGFGYMGRRLAWAAALHIPNGVLITALAAGLLAVALLTRPTVELETR
jgi:hypothetical protein